MMFKIVNGNYSLLRIDFWQGRPRRQDTFILIRGEERAAD
jgi:hypothetical protein